MRRARRRPGPLPGDMNPYLRAAEERLRADRLDSDALFTRAAFLAGRGELETAAGTLNRVADVDPEYPGLWRFLARLYDEMGEDRLAGLCLARAALTGGDRRACSR